MNQLAGRLGIGERQLRQLFQQHLGAPPIAIAQTRRILFAKQLISETNMPLAQVALAAGFGSVRRINAIFQVLFDRPPRELRRPRGASKSHAEAGITLQLSYKPPYDWDSMTSFLAARAIPGVEMLDECGNYLHTIAIGNHPGTLRVARDPDHNRLVVNILFSEVSALAIIVARVRHLFDLGADPVRIGAHLNQDPMLRPMVAARPGLRVPGAWDGFELRFAACSGNKSR